MAKIHSKANESLCRLLNYLNLKTQTFPPLLKIARLKFNYIQIASTIQIPQNFNLNLSNRQ